jgi:hypothetical protein
MVERGEVELLPLIFLLIRRSQFNGGILPSLPCHPTGGTPGRPSLLPHPQLLIASTVCLSLHRILTQVDALRHAVSIHKALHKVMTAMRG